MSHNTRASTAHPAADAPPKTYYEQQRELLILEIAQSLNTALHNLNHLNRSLEEVIQVGNEFAPVESLWSHFESVMGDQGQEDKEGKKEGDAEEGASTRESSKMAGTREGDSGASMEGREGNGDQHEEDRHFESAAALPTVMVNVNQRSGNSLWEQPEWIRTSMYSVDDSEGTYLGGWQRY